MITLKKYLNNLYGKKKEIHITNSGRTALFCILKIVKNKNSQILIPSYSCFGLIQPILSSDILLNLLILTKN